MMRLPSHRARWGLAMAGALVLMVLALIWAGLSSIDMSAVELRHSLTPM